MIKEPIDQDIAELQTGGLNAERATQSTGNGTENAKHRQIYKQAGLWAVFIGFVGLLVVVWYASMRPAHTTSDSNDSKASVTATPVPTAVPANSAGRSYTIEAIGVTAKLPDTWQVDTETYKSNKYCMKLDSAAFDIGYPAWTAGASDYSGIVTGSRPGVGVLSISICGAGEPEIHQISIFSTNKAFPLTTDFTMKAAKIGKPDTFENITVKDVQLVVKSSGSEGKDFTYGVVVNKEGKNYLADTTPGVAGSISGYNYTTELADPVMRGAMILLSVEVMDGQTISRQATADELYASPTFAEAIGIINTLQTYKK